MTIKLIAENCIDPAKALGLEGTPFENPKDLEKNKELRILDIIYTLRSMVEKMRPGQEIIIPLSGNTSHGRVTVQIAIGKDTSTNFHFRIIDTHGALLAKENYGLIDLLQIGTMLAVNKINDLTFKDLTLDQVTDNGVWKAIIDFNIGYRKAQQIQDLFQPIFNRYRDVLKKSPKTTHQHQKPANNTGEDSTVMAWIESKASPVLYNLIVLNRINVGFEILAKLNPETFQKRVQEHRSSGKRKAKDDVEQLIDAGIIQFEKIYSELNAVLAKDYNPANTQSEIKRLQEANAKLARDLFQLADFESAITDAKRKEEMDTARLMFCVESKQSSKKVDSELKIPEKSTLFKSDAEKKYEKWQQKKAEYSDYLKKKADVPKQREVIQEQISLNSNQIADWEKAGSRHANYRKVLEYLYNNYPVHDKAAVKVTVADIDKAEDWVVLDG